MIPPLPQGVRPDGPAACYRDPARRAALLALFDDGFPGLSDGIARAAADGFPWDAVTEPFVLWDGDVAIAHVGVLEHRVRLAGRDRRVAGVHAVVTRSDRRRQGLARRLLDEATAWIDARYDLSKLGTDFPDVYAPHGYRTLPLHAFAVDHRGGADRGRPLADADLPRLLATCDARDPLSHQFASRDPGWLLGVNLALQRRSFRDLVALDPLDAIVDWRVRDGVLEVHDVLAERLPPLADLLALAPPHERVTLHFCPDRLAPDARPIPTPEDGVWMVRGDWPLPPDLPFAVPHLAAH